MKLYQTICIIFCFSFFVAGLTTKAPFAFVLAIFFGVLTRVSKKKGWSAMVSMMDSGEHK